MKKQLSNEELVEQIRSGRRVSENMETLYKNNLPLIRQFIRPFIYLEPEPDLLQQAYIGLWTATTHYENSENVKFMTYARYWIQQDIRRYLENCGSIIRIPSQKKQDIIQYKRFVREYEQECRRTPTDSEAAEYMGVSEEEVQKSRIYSQHIGSLDSPLNTEDGELTLLDTIADSTNMEDDTIDRLHKESVRKELWNIVRRYTDETQGLVVVSYYRQGKTLTQIGQELGISIERVRQLKAAGLRKLRRNKALTEIKQKCEVIESDIYRTGFNSFKYKGSSSVEDIIMKLESLEEQYGVNIM